MKSPESTKGRPIDCSETQGASLVEFGMRYQARLPLPPSANNLVAPVRRGKYGRLVKTGEARQWLLVAALALRGTASRPLEGPLALELRFALPSIASDLDNRIKALLDALVAARWMHDDCQIVRLVATKSVCHRGALGSVDASLWQTETDALTARRLENSKRATS